MKRNYIWNVLLIVSACVFLFCVWNLGSYYYDSYKVKSENDALAEKFEKAKAEQTASPTPTTKPQVSEEPTSSPEPKVLPIFDDLLKECKDIVGWIKIDDTDISYPVVQTENNTDYCRTLIDGKTKDNHGVIFVDYQSDVFKPSTNIIIYGHNMRDGTMFAQLHDYKEKSFYKKHKIIEFDTLYEEAEYEIVSVALTQIATEETKDDFHYYTFFNAKNEKEFNEFYDNMKKLQLYDTGVKAKYGDTFISLSTCSKHVDGGRLVVFAKKITDEK